MISATRFYSSAAATTTPSAPKVVSSCAAGTVIKNLNIEKGQDPIVAKEDGEYPAWLWTVLDPKEVQEKRLWETDPVKAAKKQRRKENRKGIKTANFLNSMSK